MNCQVCQKESKQSSIGRHLHSGKWRHRGPATKRTIKPNLQKWQGIIICTSCLRTFAKQNKQDKRVENVKV